MFYQIQPRDETNQRLKQPKINKIEPRKGSKLWPTTKTWPSIEIPLPTRRRQNTHTHSNARARTNWASRRRSVTTHNTWSCSRDRGKMATHSLTKRSFQKNNLEKQVPKRKKQTKEVFSMKRKKN